jgi:membrane protein DedA with SNARE-associated domain
MRAAIIVVVIVVLAPAGLLGGFLDAITGLITEYGYPAVFAAAFLEVIFPPIPSEVVFPLVGFSVHSRGLGLENAIGMATVGALGSTAGAIFIYIVSLKIGRAAIMRFGRRVRVSELEIEKAERWFAKYGSAAVFTGRMIPGIREIISIPAGISRMNFAKFVAYTFAGSLVWCTILTLIGYYLGEAWIEFSEQASSAFAIVSIIVVVGIAAGIGIWYSRRRKAPGKNSH